MDQQKKIVATFNAFNGKNLELLDTFYSEKVIFEDPVTRVDGLPALKRYYSHAYSNVRSIRFAFHDFIVDGNKVGGAWTMTLDAKNLNGGRAFEVPGFSVFHFDSRGLVEFHRDYVDLGAMIYERLPLQGQLIRLIKKLLHPKT